MNTSFLFLDESYCEQTTISSVTGILVPIEKYAAIRNGFYSKMRDVLSIPSTEVARIPDLHGCDFLREESDEVKFAAFRAIVNLIRENKIDIFRVGYYITRHIERMFRYDNRLHALSFLGILWSLSSQLEKTYIIPVMDGLDTEVAKRFSGGFRGIDQLRAMGLSGAISIAHSENILGEVFYAKREYSICEQITDVVAYLRSCSDYQREKIETTEFKQNLIEISKGLEESLIREEIGPLNIQGQT